MTYEYRELGDVTKRPDGDRWRMAHVYVYVDGDGVNWPYFIWERAVDADDIASLRAVVATQAKDLDAARAKLADVESRFAATEDVRAREANELMGLRGLVAELRATIPRRPDGRAFSEVLRGVCAILDRYDAESAAAATTPTGVRHA